MERRTADKSSDVGEAKSSRWKRKICVGEREKKDVKNEGRTDYVYENKDTDDNFTDTKDGISA